MGRPGGQARFVVLLALLLAAAASSSSRGQGVPAATQPAAAANPAPPPPAVSGRFDREPLRREGNASATPQPSRADPSTAAAPSGGGVNLERLIVSLAIVLAAIAATSWIYRRLAGVTSASRPGGAVRLLGRTVLSPKQHVLLVQVGRRVIVVADSGGQMSPLSEITDEEEIAQLISQAKGEVEAAAFERLVGSERARFDPADAADETPAGSPGDDAPPPALRSEIGSLLERVRTLSSQFRKP